jgi:hypothetical protein
VIEVLGTVLAAASILPVVMKSVETCIITSLGLGALALLGVALATDTGHESRCWLAGFGVALTCMGVYLQRRRYLKEVM